MNIVNLSSNAYTFTAVWPDGSTQSVTLPGGLSVNVPGCIDALGVTNADSYDHCYQLVIDNVSGAVLHEGLSPAGVMGAGFGKGLVLAAVMVCVWMIVRGLRPSLPRD
jgi:hypothetical protein